MLQANNDSYDSFSTKQIEVDITKNIIFAQFDSQFDTYIE